MSSYSHDLAYKTYIEQQSALQLDYTYSEVQDRNHFSLLQND